MKVRFFTVKKSVIYKGKVVAPGTVIVDVDNDHDIKLKHLKKMAEEINMEKAKKLAKKSKVFIPKQSPEELFKILEG